MTLFQADELTHLTTSAPLGSVVLDTSSTVVSIKKIDIYPAHNIKDVISILPLCIYKKNFVLYTSSPKHHFNNLITMNQSVHANYFTLDNEYLTLFQYNNKTHKWLSYKKTITSFAQPIAHITQIIKQPLSIQPIQRKRRYTIIHYKPTAVSL